MQEKKIELTVGLFVLIGIIASLILAIRIADSQFSGEGSSYSLSAKFDNIGGLKVRSPVKVGGVVVGRVSDIQLDTSDYMPIVSLEMYERYGYYPENSALSILTSGLLGEQYLALNPGFIFDDENEILAAGGEIEDTKSALVLEDLIGQVLYSITEKE